MVLTLLPTAAFAAGKIWVGTEEELLAALADNTIDKITLTADITVSQTLVIDRQVVLVLDHSLKIDREQSSSGTLFHITKSGYLDTNAGSITDNVLNEGKFFPRQISGEVINEGEIIRGSFSGKVKNRGSINNGSFRGEVENDRSGKITGDETAIADAKDVLAKKGATYQNVYFDSSSPAGAFTANIFAFPTTYVVDRNGNIVGEPIVGAITEKNQAETLQSLIDQAIAADAG